MNPFSRRYHDKKARPKIQFMGDIYKRRKGQSRQRLCRHQLHHPTDARQKLKQLHCVEGGVQNFGLYQHLDGSYPHGAIADTIENELMFGVHPYFNIRSDRNDSRQVGYSLRHVRGHPPRDRDGMDRKRDRGRRSTQSVVPAASEWERRLLSPHRFNSSTTCKSVGSIRRRRLGVRYAGNVHQPLRRRHSHDDDGAVRA